MPSRSLLVRRPVRRRNRLYRSVTINAPAQPQNGWEVLGYGLLTASAVAFIIGGAKR